MGSAGKTILLALYNLIWSIALPFIKRHGRAGIAFEQRILANSALPAVDLWIQAASAGEAYLAGLLAAGLHPRKPLRILFTTNTRQGYEILEKRIPSAFSEVHPMTETFIQYLPFDQPRIMARAVAQAGPRVVVLLETELWPAMLYFLHKSGCPVLMINGRLTPKSLLRYRALSSNWSCLAPDRIEAISTEDARRFRWIFPNSVIRVMNNMKFDRITLPHASDGEHNLDGILSGDAPLVVLGSVRQPEEEQVTGMLTKILARRPDVQIALVPRHMHRLSAWKERLTTHGLAWVYRSRITVPPGPGTVILWDTFGELMTLYGRAWAVFVGGSLLPLGGQNFLEPLTCGVTPVIGPHWDNFRWLGSELFHQGLVRQVENGAAAAEQLLKDLQAPGDRETVAARAMGFVRNHQGGTARGCRLIEEQLYGPPH